jgi:hypothetical protein
MSFKRSDLLATNIQIKGVINKNADADFEILRVAIAEVIHNSPVANLCREIDASFNATYYAANYSGTQLSAFKKIVLEQVEAFDAGSLDRPTEREVEYIAASKLFSCSTVLGDDIEDDLLDVFDVEGDGGDGGGNKNIPRSARGRGPKFRY